jgi:hypothetical protein
MAIGVAPGTPQYSGNFIPEIWSGKLLVKFYAATVSAAICNTDYEGEIKDVGDVVQVRTVPDIVIRNYVKNQSLQIQRPDSPKKDMPIDKAKYFNFICDDIDKHQTDVALMDSWSRDASQQMKIEVDEEFLADIFSDASADNQGITAGVKSNDIDLGVSTDPVIISKASVLDFLVDVGTVMDEQNLPEESRWAVIPPWFAGMIKKSDLKDASLAGDGTSIMRNGRIGMIDRLTIYVSNLLNDQADSGYTTYDAIAGHKAGISWASQMTKMESLRAESTFGTLVRGLNVYGYKVLKPEALCWMYIARG